MNSEREIAVEILCDFYSKSSVLKTIQNNYYSKYNISDRNRIHVLTKEILRWKGRIDWYIAKYLNSPFEKLQLKLLVILELATYELLMDDHVPNYAAISSAVELAKKLFNQKIGGLVNAVLRKISNTPPNHKPKRISDCDWYSYPEWLFTKWLNDFGRAKTISLCNHFNLPTKIFIRRNRLKINHIEFIDMMKKDKIEISQIDNSDCFYRVNSSSSSLKNHPLFMNGSFSFQDRAAGTAIEILDPKPNDVVLDVCCAPGTKTNYIAELMNNEGKVYASDNNATRIQMALIDSKRTENRIINWEQKDAIKDSYPMADKVLIDAPCTGTGVIGRRTDIKWRRKEHHLRSSIALQKAIISNISTYVKQGGILVYSTCSLEDEENWQVVNSFLKLHVDFKVVSIMNPHLNNYIDEKGAFNTFPPSSEMDGMFAVKMMRQ